MKTSINEIKEKTIMKKSDPSIIREDETKTTENSKHFIMNNGLEKTVISNAKINCFNENNKKWQEIDNSLEDAEDGFVKAKFGKYTAKLACDGEREAVEISNGTQKIAWEYLGTQDPSESLKTAKHGSVPEKKKADVMLEKMIPGSAGIGASSRAVYKSADGEVDIDYSISANRLKENIIVNERKDEYKYYFAFNVDSFNMRLSEDNSRIEFYNSTQGTEDSKPELVMPSPFMYDAKGAKSEDVYYKIEEKTDGGYIFSVNASEEWINAKERVFPVTIDPQITDPNKYSDIIRIISEEDYYVYNVSCGEYTFSRHVTTESPAKRLVKNTTEHKESIKFVIDTNAFVGYENMKKHICAAKLVIPVISYSPNSIIAGNRMIYVNGVREDFRTGYNSTSKKYIYNITSLLEENFGGEITVEIKSDTIESIEFSSTADPYVEISYESKTYSNRATVELNPMERVKATVDLTTGEQEIDFEDISDAALGIGISHHYKKTSSKEDVFGDNFTLNIDETLKKSGSNYLYTDPKGDVHTLTEKFYRVDSSGARVEVNKSDVIADADGKLWDYENNEVKRELVSKDGYRAVSEITGVAHCELIETRGDEEKQIEEKMKAYNDSLCDFVLANKESGTIEHRCESAENYEAFIANAADSNLLLTESEAISYKSLKVQHAALGYQETAYDNQIASLNLSNTSLQRTLDNITAQKSMIDPADDEKYSIQMEILDNQITLIGKQRTIYEKQLEIGQLESQLYSELQQNSNSTLSNSINGLYDDINDLQAQIYNVQINSVTKQRTLYDGADDQNYYTWMEIYGRQESDAEAQQGLIPDQTALANNQKNNTTEQKSVTEAQIALLVAKSDEYKELAANYYKEYANLSIQLESIRRQIPVSYLISDSVIKGYNRNGELVIIQDKHEKYVAVERGEVRNGVVRVLSITDEKGRGLKFDYEKGGNARLKSITNTKGETVSYEYDGYYLKSVKYPNGDVLNLTYDTGNNRVINTELISSDGESVKYKTSFIYNEYNYLDTVKTESNISCISSGSVERTEELITLSSVNIDYTEDGAIVKQAGEPDRIYVYDSTGLLNKYFEAIDGKVTHGEAYTYSSAYNIKTKTQYLASHILNRTAYTPNLVFTVGEEESVTLNSFYDAVSGKKVVYSETGAIKEEDNTEYSYNSDRKVTLAKTSVKKKNTSGELSDYCTAIERRYYNNRGDLIRKESYIEGEEKISGINTEEYIYDEKGYEIKSYKYNSLESSSKFYKESEIDEDGRVLADYDSTGEHKTEYEYDSDGTTVIGENLADGSKFSYGKDSSGVVTGITHSTKDGEASSVEREYTEDVMTGLKSGNNKVKYSYDEKRRVKSVDLNDIPEYIKYTYTGENTDSETTVAEMKNGARFTTVKDRFGNIKSESVVNENDDDLYEQTVSYSYDLDNRVTCTNDSEFGNTSYTYDAEGKVTGVTMPCVTEEYSYDGEGKLSEKRESINGEDITYTYIYKDTAARELDKITVDGIAFEAKTDVYGRNTGKNVRISDEKCAEEQITYLKFGDRATNMPSTVRYGNKVNGKFILMDSLKYKYDAMGNITEMLENGMPIARYEYDTLGRITREDNRKFGKTKCFAYDNNGNILARYEYAYTTVPTEELYTKECESILYGYDNDSDRLLRCGEEDFEYDSIGNPTLYRGKSTCFIYGRRLLSYGENSFWYDSRGRRTSKNDIMYKYNSDGKLIWQSNGLEFMYDHTGVSAVKYNGSTYIYRKNAQNDIIALLDTSGKVVVKYYYDAWGNTITEVLDQTATAIASLNPFRYRSYYYDRETDLYYLQSRYYDPKIGRFITIDDISYLDPDTVNGLNLYAYCHNNPVMYSDGSGRAPEWLVNLLTGIVIIVGTALFVAAIVASAGTVGALVGVGAAAIGLSTTAVSTAITVATISTYVVAGGVALFGSSDAIEAFSGGINPIRDYVMGGNQTAYNITSGIFNALGTVAVIAGMVGPKVLQKIAQHGGVPKISNGKTVGYSMDFFDKKGNWNFRIDATTHGNPNAASWHHDPHYHVVDRGGDGTALYYLWEIIKRLF